MTTDTLDPTDVASLHETIASLEAQLASLYEDREGEAEAHAALAETIASLDAQVRAHIDEKAALAAALDAALAAAR